MWKTWEPRLKAAAHLLVLAIVMFDAWILLLLLTPAQRPADLSMENASSAAAGANAQVAATSPTATSAYRHE